MQRGRIYVAEQGERERERERWSRKSEVGREERVMGLREYKETDRIE